MPVYKNIGLSTKTFYGIKIKPGEQKKVPGSINDLEFMYVGLDESSDVSTKKTRKSRSNNKTENSASTNSSESNHSVNTETEESAESTKEEEVKTEDGSALEIPA